MEESLHQISAEPKNKHTIFVETKHEAEEFDPVKFFDTVPEAVDRTFNRPKLEQLTKEDLIVNRDNVSLREVEKAKKRMYAELEARKKRQEHINTMRVIMSQKKQLLVFVVNAVPYSLQTKEKPVVEKPAEDGKPPVYKWSRERKK